MAESFEVAPDLIVISAFERAQDTALPTSQRFPERPVEIYLSPAKCANTTAADRKQGMSLTRVPQILILKTGRAQSHSVI